TYDDSAELYTVTPTTAAANTAANYTFNSINYDHREAVETLWQGRLDYRTPISLGDDSTIQAGVKFINRDKTNERDFRTYGIPTGATAFGLVEAGAAGHDGGTTFDGRYVFGPTINYDAAQAFVVANPTRIQLSVSGSIGNSLLNDYKADE